MLSLCAGGCAELATYERDDAAQNIAFLTQALNAKPERREALWRANRDGDGSDGGELRAALLQSLPDHSGYDPAAARRRLGALAARRPSREIVDLAKLRLAELRVDEDYRADLAELRERLAKLIDIERDAPRKDGSR